MSFPYSREFSFETKLNAYELGVIIVEATVSVTIDSSYETPQPVADRILSIVVKAIPSWRSSFAERERSLPAWMRGQDVLPLLLESSEKAIYDTADELLRDAAIDAGVNDAGDDYDLA
jgi:hypothetical protein